MEFMVPFIVQSGTQIHRISFFLTLSLSSEALIAPLSNSYHPFSVSQSFQLLWQKNPLMSSLQLLLPNQNISLKKKSTLKSISALLRRGKTIKINRVPMIVFLLMLSLRLLPSLLGSVSFLNTDSSSSGLSCWILVTFFFFFLFLGLMSSSCLAPD